MIFLVFFISIIVFLFCQINHKLEAINKGKIIYVNHHQNKFSNLIFKNYAIPLQVNNQCMVEVIIPDLHESGQLQYHPVSYYLSQISIPKFAEHKKIIEFRAIDELKKYVKEHIKTEQEISKLQEQRSQIIDLSKLVSKSDIYSNQIETFDKALTEIDKLIDKAKQLEQLYSSLVKEGLIGVKISNYNPNLLENNSLSYKTKHEQLRGEYQYLKDTAKAYEDLMQKYHK